MQVSMEKTQIRDVFLVTPELFQDDRGFFTELYRKDQFEALGMPGDFVQWNYSGSAGGVIRGLHFQYRPPMAKLVQVVRGEVLLLTVDVRKGSPTLGEHVAVRASAENHRAVLAPAGCARGFAVLSEYAEIMYLCSACYDPTGESSILWNDPALGIEWPVTDPVLSARDREAQTLAEWLERPEADLFSY